MSRSKLGSNVSAAFRHFSRAALVLTSVVCLAEPPKDPGFVERAERTLVQLTVRVRPRAPEHWRRAAHLTKDDLSVVLDDKEIPEARFTLDNYCPEPSEPATERPPEAQDFSKRLLFFVDALGPESRDNTKAMLQAMIPKLAAEGYEMRVLPGGAPGWTGDVGSLLRDAATAVEPWRRPAEDAGTSPEDELRALLAANEVDRAIELAKDMELAEQISFGGPSLQLAEAISEMGPLPMPKALVYFAELPHSFREMIVDTAVRAGVAVYAVKADGLAPYDPSKKTVDDPGSIITMSLLSLSEHTGGRFSLGHFRPSASEKILERVESDLRCVYVLSFDAADLDRDRTLRPKIRLRSPLKSQLIAETIPDLTIPSERRLHEETVAITLRSGSSPGVQPAGVSFIPFGVDEGKVSGLIQFTLGSGLAEPGIPTSWDVGVNYFGASRVSGYGGIRLNATESTVVFQKTARLPFGPYSIVGVALEVGGQGRARGTAAGILSRPQKGAVGFLHPPSIVQWRPETFVTENSKTQNAGWTPVRFGLAASDRPTSLVTPLCRGAAVRGTLTIETQWVLPGDETRTQVSRWPEPKGARCFVLRDDLFQRDALPWTDRPYEATVVVNVHDAAGRTLAKHSKAFWVIGPHR